MNWREVEGLLIEGRPNIPLDRRLEPAAKHVHHQRPLTGAWRWGNMSNEVTHATSAKSWNPECKGLFPSSSGHKVLWDRDRDTTIHDRLERINIPAELERCVGERP